MPRHGLSMTATQPTCLNFRAAVHDDLQAIINLIADDGLGRGREITSGKIADEYEAAFAAIDADSNQLLAVVESNGTVVGCMQISFIPGLSRRGAWRGQIESVRVTTSLRGRGIGKAFFEWAIGQCRSRGCRLVQLTTDRQRPEALRFYERLGFVASHNGMKLQL